MRLITYLDKRVHITLNNSFYYKGVVVEADEDSLTLIDFKGQRISLSKNAIETIMEVFS